MAIRRKLCIAFLCAAVAAAAADVTYPGLRRFSQVNDHVCCGAQPTAEGFVSLAQLGVHTVVDLREAGERATVEQRLVTERGMKYYSVPMRGVGVPDAAKVAFVLRLLDESQNWPVFIHCRRGKDRTGTVIACYRITHDRWANEQALTEARDFGMSRFERGMQRFILNYHPATVMTLLNPANR